MNRITFKQTGDRTFKTFLNGVVLTGTRNIEVEQSPEGYQATITLSIYQNNLDVINYLRKLPSKTLQFEFPAVELPACYVTIEIDEENANEILDFLTPREYRLQSFYDTFSEKLKDLCELYGVELLVEAQPSSGCKFALIDSASLNKAKGKSIEEIKNSGFSLYLDRQDLIELIGCRE